MERCQITTSCEALCNPIQRNSHDGLLSPHFQTQLLAGGSSIDARTRCSRFVDIAGGRIKDCVYASQFCIDVTERNAGIGPAQQNSNCSVLTVESQIAARRVEVEYASDADKSIELKILLPCRRRPHSDIPAIATGRQSLAIATECQLIRTASDDELPQLLLAFGARQIPDNDELIGAAGGEQLAIGTEFDGQHGLDVAGDPSRQRTGLEVPDFETAIDATDSKEFAVWTECEFAAAGILQPC